MTTKRATKRETQKVIGLINDEYGEIATLIDWSNHGEGYAIAVEYAEWVSMNECLLRSLKGTELWMEPINSVSLRVFKG